MILWELWHEQVPFQNDLKLAKKYILEEDSRPMIEPEKCSNGMA